jgi:hypothetical protein
MSAAWRSRPVLAARLLADLVFVFPLVVARHALFPPKVCAHCGTVVR